MGCFDIFLAFKACETDTLLLTGTIFKITYKYEPSDKDELIEELVNIRSGFVSVFGAGSAEFDEEKTSLVEKWDVGQGGTVKVLTNLKDQDIFVISDEQKKFAA